MTITVIESHRSLLESLMRLLKSEGHQVYGAFDGVIGCVEFHQETDLLLLDALSPRIQYQEVIEILKKKKKDLKIALLLEESIDAPLLLNNKDIDEFIYKPFLALEIKALLESIDIDKNKEPFFLTYKEYRLYKEIKDNGLLEYKDIDKHLYPKGSYQLYIDVLNAKIGRNCIEKEKTGLRWVNDYV